MVLKALKMHKMSRKVRKNGSILYIIFLLTCDDIPNMLIL